MIYNFDEEIDRKNTQSVKIDALPQGCCEDSISAWIADMDFACAKPILDALQERLDKRIFGYTSYEHSKVKDATCSWFNKRYDLDINKNEIVYSPGIVPALAFLINILSKENDEIIIQRPVYYPFTKKIEANKRRVLNNPLIYENGQYKMDFEHLEKAFARASGMILCSPANPVGRVWSEEELIRVVDIAKRHNKWIISDEIHMDLTRQNVKHLPLLKVAPEYAQNIYFCSSPSKTFNIAGLALSNLIIKNEQVRKEYLNTLCESYSLASPSPFAISAAVAAYEEGEEWLEQLRTYLDESFIFVEKYLKERLPEAILSPAAGTYLAWINCRAYEKDAKGLEKIMQNAGLAFDEGYIFGAEGSGFERINIAMPRARVKAAIDRMSEALLRK